MKKIMAMFLVLVMSLSLVACSGNGKEQETPAEKTGENAPASETAKEENAEAATDTENGDLVKIGFICWGYTDAESRTYVRLLDYAGEACGFEPVYATYTDNEDIINQTESLIQSGCKGIISIIATPAQMDLCDAAGVYLSQWASEVNDPEVVSYLEQSPYWVGTSLSDNVLLGEQMVDKLYEAGCRNLLVAGPSSGNAVHDLRMEGIYNAVEKYPDLNVAAEWRDPDWQNKVSDSVTSYLNMYSEIDGIVTTGGSNGICDAVVQVLVNTDKVGKVKYSCVDVVDNTATYLEEGSLTACVGFTCTDVVWLSIVMTNKVNGWEGQLPVSIHMQACVISSVDDYNNFNTYVQGENVQPFSAEEYQSITYTVNPDVKVEDIEALAGATSLEDLSTKAK